MKIRLCWSKKGWNKIRRSLNKILKINSNNNNNNNNRKKNLLKIEQKKKRFLYVFKFEKIFLIS